MIKNLKVYLCTVFIMLGGLCIVGFLIFLVMQRPLISEMTFEDAENTISSIWGDKGYEILKDDSDSTDISTYDILYKGEFKGYIILSNTKDFIRSIYGIMYRISISPRKYKETESVGYSLEENPEILELINAISLRSFDRDEVLELEKGLVDRFNEEYEEKGAERHYIYDTYEPQKGRFELMYSLHAYERYDEPGVIYKSPEILFFGVLK